VLQDRSNVVNQIRIRLADVSQAEPLARRIEKQIRYRTESWEETNSNVLSLFVIQNSIMYSVVGAILLVTAFGIYNIISTVVFEKTHDIAILRSMGFAQGDILAIFLSKCLAPDRFNLAPGDAAGAGSSARQFANDIAETLRAMEATAESPAGSSSIAAIASGADGGEQAGAGREAGTEPDQRGGVVHPPTNGEGAIQAEGAP